MISICIPSRANVLGLWATICACETQLEGIPHEYLIGMNGKPMDEPHELLQANCHSGILRMVYIEEPQPPPIVRNLLAEKAKGEVLVFFDDHCIPDKEWFEKVDGLLWDVADIVHTSYRTHVGYHSYFHYFSIGDNPCKGDYSRNPASGMPYKCLGAGHAGFAVKRSAWDAIGGYDDFWQGFGGEEAYFDLKAIKSGYDVWMEPGARFYHFSCRPEVRGYDKTQNPYNFEEGYRRLGPIDLEALKARGYVIAQV
jgi:hypothetical protein